MQIGDLGRDRAMDRDRGQEDHRVDGGLDAMLRALRRVNSERESGSYWMAENTGSGILAKAEGIARGLSSGRFA